MAMTPLSDWKDSEIETLSSSENQLGKSQRCGRLTRKRIVIAVVVTALLAVVVGFLIGYFVPKSKPCSILNSASEDVHDKFEDRVSATELEKEFR